jgi:hypothetical protein
MGDLCAHLGECFLPAYYFLPPSVSASLLCNQKPNPIKPTIIDALPTGFAKEPVLQVIWAAIFLDHDTIV